MRENKRSDKPKPPEPEARKETREVDKTVEVVIPKQMEPDEILRKKFLRIEPYDKFKKGKKTASIDAPEVKLMGAFDKAEKMVEKGANPESIVSIILQDKKGMPGEERHTTLEEFIKPKTKKRLSEELSRGGWISIGSDSKALGGGGDGGFRADQAASTLLKFAGLLAEKSEKEPAEKRKEYARAVADTLHAVNNIISGGAIAGGTLAGSSGGAGGMQKLGEPFRGPTWYQLDEKSKLMATWWMENVKFRGQYSYAGEWLGRQFGPAKFWKKLQKARKKRKKYNKLEKMLDIFYINIEDVFEIDKLTAQEVFDLEKYDKKHPTETQYKAMLKLMKEEGYVEERHFVSSVKLAKKFQPSDVYYGR